MKSLPSRRIFPQQVMTAPIKSVVRVRRILKKYFMVHYEKISDIMPARIGLTKTRKNTRARINCRFFSTRIRDAWEEVS
jgi:hypothetical protein